MKRTLFGTVLIAMVALVGCAPTSDPVERVEPVESVKPVESLDPRADETEHSWVQDLWIYESISKIDEDGAFVDLTGGILAHLEASDGDEHELPDGARFVVHPSLAPSIVGGDGLPRTDVEVLAGVLIDGDARGIAVLATPDADAATPVGLDDLIELDLTFIVDLAPGDAISADIAFLQAFMGPAPSAFDSVALLAHRLAAGDVQYYGSASEVGVFTMQLGQAVSGSTRGQLPAKSDPMIDGFKEGLEGCKGDLKCVSDYFQKFGGGAEESLKLLECNLSPCNEPVKTDPIPEPTCVVGVKGGGCPKVEGDPHITTVDGRHLSMQAVGEFVGLRSDRFEVQIRTTPWNDSRTVSVLSAVTVGSGTSTVMVDIFEGDLRLQINGDVIEPEIGTARKATDLTATAYRGLVQVTHPGGETITIRRTGVWNLSLSMSVDEDADFTGILAGTDLPSEYDHHQFYDEFVNAWRVSHEASLFTYDAGQAPASFTDLSFPDEFVTIDTLAPRERARALALCTAVGITSPAIIDECVFDYAVTGAIEFVRAAKTADAIEMMSTDQPQGQRPETPVNDAATVSEEWRAAASYVKVGDIVTYQCSAGGSINTVWGGMNGVYTSDSSVCSAAVHHGDLTVERGGSVTIERTDGQETYGEGTTENGVTTRNWLNSWSGSFIFTTSKN